VSSEEVTTRSRIVRAALSLIEQGHVAISMGAIAKEAGLSRQALYLTFADRAELFIAVLRFADGQRGMVEEWARIRATATARDALLAIIDRQARLGPAYKCLADAFEVLRRQDAAAEEAWQDRQRDRLEGCRMVAVRLAAEGALRPGLDVATAADLIWSITASTVWDDLVTTREWSAAAYREQLAELLMRWLTLGS
jgi:AcrR family transcriptional regulator